MFLFLTLFFLAGCNDAAITPSFNDGTGGQGNIAPQPTPTPLPDPTPEPPPNTPQIKTVTFLASDLNEADANMVYKKRIEPIQLAVAVEDKDCHQEHQSKCIKNRQVLFQFNIEEINKLYPSYLWDILSFELKASYFSVSAGLSHELICLLNNKVCSGVEIDKYGGLRFPFIWRNSKFWTNNPKDHVVNDHFSKFLKAGVDTRGVTIWKNKVFDLTQLLGLTERTLLTTIRKNNELHFSVTSDTFIEDPELTIKVKRRLLSR